jgi:hypothetical protein
MEAAALLRSRPRRVLSEQFARCLDCDPSSSAGHGLQLRPYLLRVSADPSPGAPLEGSFTIFQVDGVDAGSVAEAAGVKAHDILLEVAGRSVVSAEVAGLTEALATAERGQPWRFMRVRTSTEVTAAERMEAVLRAYQEAAATLVQNRWRIKLARREVAARRGLEPEPEPEPEPGTVTTNDRSPSRNSLPVSPTSVHEGTPPESQSGRATALGDAATLEQLVAEHGADTDLRAESARLVAAAMEEVAQELKPFEDRIKRAEFAAETAQRHADDAIRQAQHGTVAGAQSRRGAEERHAEREATHSEERATAAANAIDLRAALTRAEEAEHTVAQLQAVTLGLESRYRSESAAATAAHSAVVQALEEKHGAAFAALSAQMAQAVATAEVREAANDALRQEMATLALSSQQLEARLEATDLASKEASAQYRELQREHNEAQLQVAALQTQTAELTSQVAAASSLRTTELGEKDTEIAELRKALEAATRRAESLEADRIEWVGLSPLGNLDPSQRSSATEAFAEAHHSLDAAKLAASTKAASKLQKKYQALVKEKEALATALADCSEASSAEAAIMTRTLKAREKELRHTKRELQRLKQQLAEAEAQSPSRRVGPGGLLGARRTISPRTGLTALEEAQVAIVTLTEEKIAMEEQHEAVLQLVEIQAETEIQSLQAGLVEIAGGSPAVSGGGISSADDAFLFDQIDSLKSSLLKTKRVSEKLVLAGGDNSGGAL